MRSRLTAALAVFAIGLAPSLAMAEDVQEQLRQMQDRLQTMEDKLQATDDQLGAANRRVEEQSELIESSGLADTRGASSGLGCLVCDWRIGGWVSASYNYNINDPQDAERVATVANPDFDPLLPPGPDNEPTIDVVTKGAGLGGTNLGPTGLFYDPLHPDHNSFALDQLWFEVEKEISEENRAGFRADFVYGKTAKWLNGGGPFNADINDDSAIYIHQAYVQYAPPIGPEGTVFKFGKFATLLGAEVAGTIYNWNITRGQVWNLLEPIDHIGVLVGGPIGESGFEWAVGGVNGFAQDDPDINDQKSVTGKVGWANDQFSVGVAGIWGSETAGFDGDESGTVNLLAKWTPSDRFGMYLNGDFGWMDEPQGTDLDDPYGWGVSLAGRYGITDRMGIALRGEYVQDNEGFLACAGKFGGLRFDNCGALTDSGLVFVDDVPEIDNLWSGTVTLDYLLTDQLMIRGEARYDYVSLDGELTDFTGATTDLSDFDAYFKDSDDFDNDQITLFVEVVYNFNKFIGD